MFHDVYGPQEEENCTHEGKSNDHEDEQAIQIVEEPVISEGRHMKKLKSWFLSLRQDNHRVTSVIIIATQLKKTPFAYTRPTSNLQVSPILLLTTSIMNVTQ